MYSSCAYIAVLYVVSSKRIREAFKKNVSRYEGVCFYFFLRYEHAGVEPLFAVLYVRHPEGFCKEIFGVTSKPLLELLRSSYLTCQLLFLLGQR
jgi:hypothetical protein